MKTNLTFFIMTPMCSFYATGEAQTIINPSNGSMLTNDFVKLKLSPGGMGLESMIDLKTGYNHVRPVKGEHLLWEVVFGKGMQRGSITNDYQTCNFTSVEKLPDGTQQAVLGWKNMRWWKGKQCRERACYH